MAISLKAPSLPGTIASDHFPNLFVAPRVVLSPVSFHQKLRPSIIDGTTFSTRRVGFRARTVVQSVMETEKITKTEKAESPVRLVALVGKGEVSPLKSTSWHEVMLHTARRLKWVDEGYEMLVSDDEILRFNDQRAVNLKQELNQTDILVVVAVNNSDSVKWIQRNSKNIKNVICFESSPELMNRLGGTDLRSGDKDKEGTEVLKTVGDAWERSSSDDIRFCLLLIINAYVRPVPVLQSLRSKGFSTLGCMVKNCGPQVLNCLLDPNCRKALQCLNQLCSPVDQICNYRCIASYESPSFEAFCLCVLQKHNCLQLDAKIPEKPYVPPMISFRGKELCHETAEDLFVGWLGDLDWSWRVAAGQNPAYDQFPCQYRLFYRGKGKSSLWYEPVYQVRTFEGKLVWRRKRYSVKRGKTPATFRVSVLDNGVVANEFWTIVDVTDDLSWGLFHYTGAAPVAGQSYTGAVLVTPDGLYPEEKERKRLQAALEKCGIKEWELSVVDNCSCENPPLGIPKGSRLHSKISIT